MIAVAHTHGCNLTKAIQVRIPICINDVVALGALVVDGYDCCAEVSNLVETGEDPSRFGAGYGGSDNLRLSWLAANEVRG